MRKPDCIQRTSRDINSLEDSSLEDFTFVEIFFLSNLDKQEDVIIIN